MAWGIGANDVANSFATSVGSRTLTLWQAVCVAAVFEFVGAITLGGETSKTIAGDIAYPPMFANVPEIYMYGMLCSLAVAGTWLLVATYWGYAVSTTHSIIGAIMGFALVYGGYDGVKWNERKGDFPYSAGFLPVVLSWFFSPVVGGILSALLFFFNRLLILRRKNSTMLAIYSLPVLIFITLFINLMFVLAKGANKELQETWPCTTSTGKWDLPIKDCSELNNNAVWIAAVVAVGVSLISGAICIPLLRRRYLADLAKSQADEEKAAAEGEVVIEAKKGAMDDHPISKSETPEWATRWMVMPEYPEEGLLKQMWYWIKLPFVALWVQCMRGLFYDVHQGVDQNAHVQAIHAAAEMFDPHTERVYQYLQVISACCVSFAHGSNDVANSIGPFSAMYYTYTTYKVPSSSTETEKWIFVFGGVGIVLGLIMYGYNIIVELGCNMLKLTPARGFSTELAAGLTIALASFFGIPVSTTQIIVGCEIGTGLTENVTTGLNFRVLGKTFLGWVMTILLAMGMSAALFSMGVYAPSIHMANQVQDYRDLSARITNSSYNELAVTNDLYRNNSAWWNGPAIPPMTMNGAQLQTYIREKRGNMTNMMNNKNINYKTADQVMWYVNDSMLLYKQFSMVSIGQNVSAVRLDDTWVKPNVTRP
eukprot:CAMPEP_0202904830 /NCGR_PEP_ID=MMETSP1392-20130828/31296_1 /ASSEMBLY_ACC=CAM_ASM_000868 /TAXON_ID=225041 /ORGANISM="Chlamydomonas chlamydogama, Strain SAG 11-48b" /LENGTH=650 /DNA_ID=CAMNT_0049592659 /DNA_START=226 /DNA_END=2178 /DNA_ORIENTATION=+